MDDAEEVIARSAMLESALRTSHRSARTPRIEVVTRRERRRWSVEEKREIVAESLVPGVVARGVMRKHGITSGQLYTWRQQLATRVDGELAQPATGFARVELVAGPRQQSARSDGAMLTGSSPRHAAARESVMAGEAGQIEIVLRNGLVVRVDRWIDSAALRRVLSVVADL